MKITTSTRSAQEMRRYLATILDSIANDLRPELQTDAARRSADSLILVLGRLIERVGSGDATAAEQAAAWDDIARAFPSFADTAPDASLRPREGIERRMEALQRSFQGSEDAIESVDIRSSAGRQRLQMVSHATSALWDAIEENVHGPNARIADTSSTTDVDALRATLGAYLKKRFPDLPENPIVSLKLYYGGYGKQTAKLMLVDNDLLPRTLVLRRDLALSNTTTRASEEFPVLQRAYALGLPLPKPILAEADPSILDGTFVLMEEVPNATAAGAPFAEDRAQQLVAYGPDFGREVARTLAMLHGKTEVAQRNVSEQEQSRDALQEDIRKLHRDWLAMDKPPMSVGIDLGFALLLDNPLPADRPHCLVHADCGMHNWLVRDGKAAALIDWELSHEGDPTEDMAIIRMIMADDVIPWEDFVREYVAAGGISAACDPWPVAYHAVLLFIRHAMMAANVRAKYHADAHDSAIAASVAAHIVDRLLLYQARALKIASDALSG
jgi:aminoglycoside phosphotransferase (APT) family kinase protein